MVQLVTLGIPFDPIKVDLSQLVVGAGRSRVISWEQRSKRKTRFALAFFRGVAPMVERIPLEKAEEVFAKMMAGQARFRMGLILL